MTLLLIAFVLTITEHKSCNKDILLSVVIILDYQQVLHRLGTSHFKPLSKTAGMDLNQVLNDEEKGVIFLSGNRRQNIF